MKKFLPIVLLTVLYSCNNSNPHIFQADTIYHAGDTPSAATHSSNTSIYKQWLSNLDTQKVTNGFLAMQRFQQLFAKQPLATCDTAFYLFDQFHARLYDYISSNPNHNDSATLIANGFRTYEEEGLPQIARSWTFLNRYFTPYVSAEMKELLTQKSKEDKEGFQDDAALTIPPDHLIERTVFWETFAHNHPAFIYTQAARDQHAFYLRVLLTGSDNTPVTTNGKLTEYYEAAYAYCQKSHSGSQTNAVLKPYYTALKTGDTLTASRIIDRYAPPHP